MVWKWHNLFILISKFFRIIIMCIFSTFQVPKVVRTLCVLYILTWKCSSYLNDVDFTSKSGPNMMCFVHFDLEICFASQRHIFFWHLKCQKQSTRGVFYIFWSGNIFRTTTTYNLLPKVVRIWYILKNLLRGTTTWIFLSFISSGQMIPHPPF